MAAKKLGAGKVKKIGTKAGQSPNKKRAASERAAKNRIGKAKTDRGKARGARLSYDSKKRSGGGASKGGGH